MEIKTKAMLLTAVAKPYTMNGNEGISYRVRVMIGGEIFPCKSNASQVNLLKPFEGKEGVAVVKVSSIKENISLELVSFA